MQAKRRSGLWAVRLACAALALWLSACATPAADDAPALSPAVARLYEALTGPWHGHLEYREAASERRIRVPATLRVSRVMGTDALRFDYEYFGGGASTRAADRGRIDLDRRLYTVQSADGAEASVYQIASVRGSDQPYAQELVLLASGLDNGSKVESRITIAVTDRTLRVLRESRPADQPAAAWQFRHEYALARP